MHFVRIRSPHNGELDLLETFTLQPCALLEPLLSVDEFLALEVNHGSAMVSLHTHNAINRGALTGMTKNLKGMPCGRVGSFWK